jgi:anti-sigma factor RsiW
MSGLPRPPDDGAGECEHAELLSGLLDDELAPAERQLVERHLLAHEACRRELDDIRQVRDSVRSLPWIDGPADFWSRLAAAAIPAATPPAAATVPARHGLHANRWLWAGAAAACLFVAAGLAGTQVDQASTTSVDDVRRADPVGLDGQGQR